MGMQIFEKSGTFKPADWGLGAGDMVQVICVGGGCSGDVTVITSSGKDQSIQGKSGGNSSFGNYVTAFGGSQLDHTICMGVGGCGEYDYNVNNGVVAAGGGAGGYMIGIPFYGGNGGNGNIAEHTTTIPITNTLPSGLGGAGQLTPESNAYVFSTGLPYANVFTRNGNKGAEGTDANGGNGYGAGGSGGGRVFDTGTPEFTHGGNSGQIMFGTVKLTSSNSITVTVGKGGTANTYSDMHGTMSSGKGADGVVVVTW